MEERKKRKAREQLSPYSDLGDEEEVMVSSSKAVGSRKKAKARVGSSAGVSNAGHLKGVLSSVNILKPSVGNDKVGGLNRCFLRAVQTVIETESNKNLCYLFRQYEKYYEELNKASD